MKRIMKYHALVRFSLSLSCVCVSRALLWWRQLFPQAHADDVISMTSRGRSAFSTDYPHPSACALT